MTTPFVTVPGSVSDMATLSSWLGSVFVSVIVNVEIPFGLTAAGAKALLTEIPLTVRVALTFPAMVRFSAFERLAGEMVLVYEPGVLLVTLTASVQAGPIGIVPPVYVSSVSPATGAKVPPAQLAFLVGFGLLETCTPEGRASEIEKFVRDESAGAVMLMESLEVPPTAIGELPKLLVTVTPRPPPPGPLPYTVRLAFAASRLVAP